MTKLKNPLLSFGATGRLGKLFSLAKRQGRHIIERRPKPTDAKSPAQLFNRHMFTKCVDLWHLLSEEEKQIWESLARPLHMTGYAWFISQCLRPNPGIYLPLQGGTMSGDIDMDKNRLLKLPEPTDPQEPATKTYSDTHSKFIWLDAPGTAKTDINRTVTLDWTALDLGYWTSPNAKLVILKLRIRADVVGDGASSFLAVRKHGTTPILYPELLLDKAGTTVAVFHHQSFIMGMDNDQLIDYTISVGTNWQLDSSIGVLGYVE